MSCVGACVGARAALGGACFFGAGGAAASFAGGAGAAGAAAAGRADGAAGAAARAELADGSGLMMLTAGVDDAEGNSALVGLPVGIPGGRVATIPGTAAAAAAGGGAFHEPE